MPNKPAQIDDPFKKVKTGGWSKHGGARLGLIHSQAEDTWYCQSCRVEQPKTLPGFLLEFLPSEFVRVCASCFHKARGKEYSYHKVVLEVRVENRSAR